MLIEIKELVNIQAGATDEDRGREWLAHEILNSIPTDLIEGAKMKGNVNVLLSIDGVLVEPKLFQEMFLKLERYIDKEAVTKAQLVIEDRMQEIDDRFNNVFEPLEHAVQKAKDKILENIYINIAPSNDTVEEKAAKWDRLAERIEVLFIDGKLNRETPMQIDEDMYTLGGIVAEEFGWFQ